MDIADKTILSAAAVAAIKAGGGPVKLAREVGITRFAVHQWKATGVPANRVRRVAAVTKMEPSDIRPDLFGAPEAVA